MRGIPAPIANVTLRPGQGLPMRLLRRERGTGSARLPVGRAEGG